VALLRRRRPRLARELVALIVRSRVTKETFDCGWRRQWRFYGTLLDERRHGVERCWYKPPLEFEPRYPMDELVYEHGFLVPESGRALQALPFDTTM
jgi:hypothetical protein